MVIKVFDKKVGAYNYTTVVSIGEYLAIAKGIVDANEFQRKRVRHSATVYSLLRKDVIDGCVMPPIVLAYLKDGGLDEGNVAECLLHNRDHLLILDGLQRTYTLLDAAEELAQEDLLNPGRMQEFLQRPLRIEFYTSINRIGILYRMLTLNTGQTQMSLRQQVEMLYFDYSCIQVDGIRFIREIDNNAEVSVGNYSFKDMIDGFNSYLERNELPIDRFDVLENIQNLKNISREDQGSDLFAAFSKAYHAFMIQMERLAGGIFFTSSTLGIEGLPFGKAPFFIFSKAQSVAGFGAAIGHLRDKGGIHDFQQVEQIVRQVRFDASPHDTLSELLTRLEDIRLSSKKIGNAQRMYFQYFFRALLNKDSEAFLSIDRSVADAYRKYQSQVL